MKKWLELEKPGVFAIDPWNRAVSDDKARDYWEALEAILSCLPDGPEKPAVVIVHHLRKQGGGDVRKHGRDLLSELSGSYLIGSSCLVAFILEPATPDAEDNRVIFSCAKNNNGALQALVKVGQSAADEALKLDGRFSEHLSESGGFIKFKP